MNINLDSTFNGLLGGAGVGKSWTLKNLNNKILTASTGIAAINLEGRTINSVLNYFNTEDLLFKVANGLLLDPLLEISKKNIYLVIDEISMTPAEQLDLICRAIEDHNEYVEYSPNLTKKHNKLKLIVSGDAAQLPPVSTGASPAKPFFQAVYWKKFNINHLIEVKRQSNKEFVGILNQIRLGNVRNVVDWFETKIGFEKELDLSFPGSTFFPTNKEVNSFNKVKLDELLSEEVVYESTRKGKQLVDWKDLPNRLVTKIGMKVMLLSNNFEDRYANGDLGIIVDTLAGGLLVRLLRDNRIVLINYKKLTNVVNVFNEKKQEYVSKVIGSIDYLPIRQGDSTSIHKSQSLSLDNVQVGVENSFLSRLSGGLYTALSRVTSYEGLRIVGTKDQFIKACYINPKYKNYLMELDTLTLPLSA